MMEQFYTALQQIGVSNNGISSISKIFATEEIIPSVLSSLTDAKLEKMGIKQLGLREAILKVVGKE